MTVEADLATLGAVGGGVAGDGDWKLPAGSYRIAIGQRESSIAVTETMALK